ncbi:MAG: hypothetical protein EPO11_11115 [Gammaproteobacteria bacterium]|nr:MAG: hypothetical protein EPO11_11115 [Gammaproteobacteria bacterium]
MKRLIISGFPCPQAAWADFLPAEDGTEQEIISFYDVISKAYGKRNFFDLVTHIADILITYKPGLIIMHDIGVTLGLLSLIRVKKTQKDFLPRIVAFNGAFRGFNVFKNTHPLRIQLMSYQAFEKEVLLNGGEVDVRFKDIFADIKHLYRQIAIFSLSSMLRNLFKKKNRDKIQIGEAILVLASKDDPYIPVECLRNIELTFTNTTLKIFNYGHFPYSNNNKEMQQEIKNFLN